MHEWTKKQEIALINEKQSFYVDSLIKLLLSDKSKVKKTINFNSSTGTGKTKMMAELFNKMPDKFFIVTTLSRGQLQRQVKKEIKKFCPQDNFYVYGLQDYTTATILTAKEITSLLPKDKEIIWVRDEGHIKTNRWEEILQDHCINKVNFSATNKDKHDISCNFTETMMLRTVSQKVGDPEEAIKKLVEIKKLHSKVADYNPCALFRLITVDEYIIKKQVVELCNQYNLKYIDLTDKDFVMDDICQDNNPYDVIINKMKIVEGIDIRRCHVLYMDNKPNNLTTTIQVIGRCRRNALLWRDDVDLFAPSNSKLLEDTRRCYVFFNVKDMSVDEKDGELLYELCDRISVEQLTEDVKIFVKNGVLPNGLQIIELEGKTGYFTIRKDEVLGFKIVENDDFYKEEKRYYKNDYCEVYYKTITYDKLEKRLNKYVWDKLGKKCGIPKSMTYDKIKEKTEKCKKSHNGRDKEFWQKILKEKPKNDDVYHWVDWYGYYDTPKYEGKYLTTWKKILQSRPQGSNSVNYKLDVDIYTRRRDREMIDKEPLYINHKKVINDKETAIIGADKFRFVEKKWVEDRAVTSKITMYSKLNTYISTRYKKEIDVALKEKFSGKNTFGFDKKLNSCLGFCVEYFTKYLLYGERYFGDYIRLAQKEYAKEKLKRTFPQLTNKAIDKYQKFLQELNDNIILRACMLSYRDNMIEAFGQGVAKVIKSISIEKLIESSHQTFVKTVRELADKSYGFIKSEIGLEKPLGKKDQIHNPNLSVRHISALCDFVTKDKIIDLKVTNYIDERYIKQVLAYHYLSTKRNDLDIKQVIVYDATSGKHIRIDIQRK